MKLKIVRAIYFNHSVVREGEQIETVEQHGRELVNKGYAKAVKEDEAIAEPTEPKKSSKKRKE